MQNFVRDFSQWYDKWAIDVAANPSRFDDPISSALPDNRTLTINHIRGEINRLVAIVERESGTVLRTKGSPMKSTLTAAQRSEARTAQLAHTYDPPGTLRRDGVRHDNDHSDIANIRIAPTHGELLSPLPPYLPVFSSDAPHHHPADSMERHLDIQFRLLREELMCVLPSSSLERPSSNIVIQCYYTSFSQRSSRRYQQDVV